jgi:chromosome transmission fidelity protein 8
MEYDGNGKNVTLIVGKHQRLRGEIVKLKNPLAILQMAGTDLPAIGPTQLSQGVADSVDIPIIEVITHKIVFNKRPEPVVYE